MENSLHQLIKRYEESWKEVDTLINMAEEVAPESTNPVKEKFDSLCRAATVLICARNEGYMKELFRAYFADINRNIEFCDIKEGLVLNSFTKYYSNIDKFKLFFKEKLSSFNYELDSEEFLNPNDEREVKGKNITTSYITKVANRVGFDFFLESINLSEFKLVFSNLMFENVELYEKLLQELLLGAEEFPYKFSLSNYRIVKLSKNRGSESGLWQGFLDNLVVKRNQIAHGLSSENSVDTNVLKDFLIKSKILSLILTLALTSDYHA